MPDFETRRADWLSFGEARERILSATRPRDAHAVPVLQAEGLAIAKEMRSRLTLPPGPTSHMDGYAFRGSDVPAVSESIRLQPLRVLGTSRPDAPWTEPLPSGGAVRIMTGALLPPGADEVCPVEESDREAGRSGFVLLQPPPERRRAPSSPAGRHVRPAGEEVRAGDVLAGPGDTVSFALLALLAAAGESAVPVHPAPVVALVVTGDELVPPGEGPDLAAGIHRVDILSPTLPRLIQSAGGAPIPSRRVRDDPELLEEALAEASEEADLILTTGGASMGEADLVKDALDALGFRLDFWRIRMRPGSPVSFGHLPSRRGGVPVPVLGLPGNPVSAMVTCLLLGLPAIRALGGHRRKSLPRIRAVAREPLPGPEHLTRFFRVRLEPEGSGNWGAYPSAPQGSGVVRSMALADALAMVPEGLPSPEPGTSVEALLLPSMGWVENE